jgi:hypothetical protein
MEDFFPLPYPPVYSEFRMHKIFEVPKKKCTSILLTYLYFIMVTSLFRSIVWPSSGRFIWDQEYSYISFVCLNTQQVIQSRIMRLAGHVARLGKGGEYSILVGRTEGKRPLERPRRRWEDNIKTYLQVAGCGYGLDWAGSG